MESKKWSIWGFAFGYFAFYIPYCALAKALSQGLLPGMESAISGFELLPTIASATTVTLLFVLTFTGAWKHMRRVRLGGWQIPAPRPITIISGIATAGIIATTTLNYTFPGLSILFALLLMRGGVLILAPIVDIVSRRRVHLYSWGALLLSLVAIGLAMSSIDSYSLKLIAGINLAVYLSGYAIRLQLMTRAAKSVSQSTNNRYFVEEAFVAALALTAVPAIIAIAGSGAISQDLQNGFSTILSGQLLWQAVAIGVLYACLYFFGSHIYLDYRENTFCIPLNRSSSLLSGVVASVGLTIFLNQPAPNSIQLFSVSLIIVAILLLASPILGKVFRTAPRTYLFICNRNASRSPMAEAICRSEFARLLNVDLESLESSGIHVLSAGIVADPGTPLKSVAQQALDQLGAQSNGHLSRQLTDDMVRKADRIYCMTKQQATLLAEQYPSATNQVYCLDPDSDIEEPTEAELESYLHLGRQLQKAIRESLQQPSELGLLSKVRKRSIATQAVGV